MTAGVVSHVLWLVGHDDAREDLGDLVDMDRAAHRVLVGEADGLAARRVGDAEDMIDRADDLVRTRDVGGPDRGDLHPVLLAVILRLPFVEDLVHRVLHMAMAEIVLGDEPVAVEFLLAADRERTGIGDPVAAGEACRFEAIIHAEDVELERDARRVLAAEPISEIDDPFGFGIRHRRHDIVELADIAADDAHLFAVIGEVRGLRVDVHADDLLAALGEQRNKAAADKAGAAEDQDRHGHSSPVRDALVRA